MGGFIPVGGLISDLGNSTTVPLNDGQIFTGEWKVREAPVVVMAPKSDQDFIWRLEYASSEADALANNVALSISYDYIAGQVNQPRRLILTRPYYRIVITNNSGANMTELDFQTSVGQFPQLQSRLDEEVQKDVDVVTTKAFSIGENPNNRYVLNRASGVNDSNSTNIPLGSNGNFTGEWEDVSGYKSIDITIRSDQPSSNNGAVIEFSHDGVNVVSPIKATVLASNEASYFGIPIQAQYFRLNYTNGAVAQSLFDVQTILSTEPPGAANLPIETFINGTSSAQIVRSVNTGKDPNDLYENEKVSGVVDAAGTTAPLGEEEEYDTGWIDVQRYSTAGLTVYSDVESDYSGLNVETSTDGVNVDANDTYNYVVGKYGKIYSIPLFSKFFRVRYKNGRVPQTEFRLQVKLFKETLKASSHRITDPVLEEDDSELVKSVIAAENPQKKFINIKSSGAGNLLVAIGERPSEVRDRIRASNNVENVSISPTPTVIHTVTPGYKLWITSVIVSALNDSTTRGRYGLYDGSTLIIPIIMPSRLSGSSPAGSSVSSPPLPEPIMVSESFGIAELAGDITASVAFVGYEERIEYQNVYSTDFEGVDEYGQLGYTADLDLSNNFAWSAWIKTSNVANNKCVLGKYGSTAADRSHFMEVTANDGFFRVYLHSPGGVKDYSSTEVVNDGNWHHLAYTFADDVLRMYIDGVEITPTKNVDGTVTAIQTNMSDTKFGALPLTGGETNYYIGMIDEITLFSKELTANEIGEIYNNGVPRDQENLSTADNIVSWWRMGDNDTFPTIRDNVGISDCTLNNMIASDFVADVPE